MSFSPFDALDQPVTKRRQGRAGVWGEVMSHDVTIGSLVIHVVLGAELDAPSDGTHEVVHAKVAAALASTNHAPLDYMLQRDDGRDQQIYFLAHLAIEPLEQGILLNLATRDFPFVVTASTNNQNAFG